MKNEEFSPRCLAETYVTTAHISSWECRASDRWHLLGRKPPFTASAVTPVPLHGRCGAVNSRLWKVTPDAARVSSEAGDAGEDFA